MSETKEYKTESKRLLDLMTNSIYTNKEIFLRELISNASDAIDKYHYLSLSDNKLEKRNDYQIYLTVDKDKRIITIEDNGIGMTHDELVNNLGTIAKSGSLEFLKNLKDEDLKKKENIDIIGQFGVGFYSAFMVSQNVVVETKSPYSEKGYRFESTGAESYTIDEIDKTSIGTKITLFLKKDTDEDKYDQYLDQYEIKELVKKYSDYVRYPIKMMMTTEEPDLDKDGKPIENKYHKVEKEETLNSMIPLWKKNKSEVKQEELNEFYKNKFYDYEDPLLATFISVEGLISYNALVFIPAHAPFDLYTEKYQKGLQLYSKGVFIKEKCDELVPDYLRFIKGLVDSSDLSLNISREILQHNSQLTKISQNIEKKVLAELEKMKNNDFEKYQKFFKIYGVNLKYGVYQDYGAKKDALKDLLIYETINSDKPLTLKQYVDQKKEGQEFIYYASAKSKDDILAMPQMDIVKKKGYDVLILKDDVDEFAINVLENYNNIKFKSINQGDLNLIDKDEEKKLDDLKVEKKPILDKIQEYLKDDVKEVVISKRLVDSPVCLVSGDGLSFEMEKVINEIPNGSNAKATKILEINANHPIFQAIQNLYEKDPDSLKEYSSMLYNQALLIEGMPIKNPTEFSKQLCELMVKAAK